MTLAKRACIARQLARIFAAWAEPVYVTWRSMRPPTSCTSAGCSRGSEVDHLPVAAPGEVAVEVEDVGDAARHARGEVAPGPTDDHDAAAGHVLAPVVAHALDDRGDAAVAYAEALPGDAAEGGLAARRAVERDVTDDDVLLGG